MDYKLELLPEAIDDIEEIVTWYDSIDHELSRRFLNSPGDILQLIELHPLIFSKDQAEFSKSQS